MLNGGKVSEKTEQVDGVEQPISARGAWLAYIFGVLFGGTFLTAMFFSLVDSVFAGGSYFGAIDSLVTAVLVFQAVWLGMSYMLCRTLKVHGANALWCVIPLLLLILEISTS